MVMAWSSLPAHSNAPFERGVVGDDELSSGIGNDFVSGGLGNDKLDGGQGADVLFGQSVYDTYFNGSSLDGDVVRNDEVLVF